MAASGAYDYAVVGGGIVGLSIASALGKRSPGARVVVVEKEDGWAAHQTGNNSGVIHSGLYYKPGSLKAKLCTAGARSMVEFCQEHGIAHRVTGKVVVATRPDEVPRLDALFERGVANGVPVRRLTPEQVCELEPHVVSVAGLHVASTGIVDYKAVCRAHAGLVEAQGGELRLSTTVTGLRPSASGTVVLTDRGDFEARTLVNCAGLQSDRVARLAGADPEARIVPFRGEYYELRPEARHLVNTLVYPVPNPAFPFLGVHFTKMIDGTVHAGPNAVPALSREGYTWRDFDRGDVAEVLSYPGFWRLARKHWDEGAREIWRSISKAAFVRSLQALVPEVTADDVVPAHAGVRAQALRADGALVDDFLVVRRPGSVHVCNAPSPAATSSLEIARAVVDGLHLPDSAHEAVLEGAPR